MRAEVAYDPTTDEILGIDLSSLQHFTGIGERYDWSPDGTLIAFINYDLAPDVGTIWIYDTITQSLLPLPITHAWNRLNWSPDGTRIAYTLLDREQHTSQIQVFNLGDLSVTSVASGKIGGAAGGTVVMMPHWSPDSTSLVYVHYERRSFSEWQDLIKISANGKGKAVNLTSELTSTIGSNYVLGWREK